MDQDKMCYVTAFLDLNRDHWQHFRRRTATYFQEFQPFLDMFLYHADASQNNLVVFMDHGHVYRLPQVLPRNVIVQEIDHAFLHNNSLLWRRLDREKAIMASQEYRALVQHRLHHPENSNPLYTMINHCKVDFLQLAMERVPHATHFAWVDFGYCKAPGSIPTNFIDFQKMDKNKVHYTLVNSIDPRIDGNVLYTLQHAPEKIGGAFFLGGKRAILAYRELYHTMHDYLQQQNIVDDDQAIALFCYLKSPELFSMHLLGGFHKALTAFQKI